MKNNVCKKKRVWGRGSGSFSPTILWLQKNSTSQEVIKILVTNIEYYNKNYLILTNFKKSNFADICNKLGEVIWCYSTFSTVTVILLSFISTIHSKLSPAPTSKICAIGKGMLVLTLLEVLFAGFIFDLFLRIIIPPYMLFYSNKFVRSIIYNYPIKLHINR